MPLSKECLEELISDILYQPDFDELNPEYWLQQLRKREWIQLLDWVSVPGSRSVSKNQLIVRALPLYEFKVFYCHRRKLARRWAGKRGLCIQFRHGDSDWTRGEPEVIYPEGIFGIVNIAAILACKLRKRPRSYLKTVQGTCEPMFPVMCCYTLRALA